MNGGGATGDKVVNLSQPHIGGRRRRTESSDEDEVEELDADGEVRTILNDGHRWPSGHLRMYHVLIPGRQ